MTSFSLENIITKSICALKMTDLICASQRDRLPHLPPLPTLGICYDDNLLRMALVLALRPWDALTV